MMVKIYSCLFAFVLGYNVSAEIIHQEVAEKNPANLPCPHPVDGDVMWSRQLTNGSKVNLIKFTGETEERHNDPCKRYSSLADKFKSLVIKSPGVSDSGTYLCNNETVKLTVIPSGTRVKNATIGTSITLKCPDDTGSHGPTLVRQISGIDITVYSQNKTEGLQYSTEDKTLTLTNVQPNHSGLYYCEGKLVVYLNVTKDERFERAAHKLLLLVLGVVLPLALTVFIILFLFRRCRFRTQGRGEQQADTDYAEIPDESVFKPTQGGSNQHDLTYAAIYHTQPAGNKTVVSRPNESIYSFVNTKD
ncbi:uncharacterized protein LOC111230636 isoform X1 [Seriola dumerili]|uniref:uncharacterized protein LOC111230636 isoform X1 n=1 Tax=Seriola dumerili TaxID=41447 RepID=UPI000BBE3114|nr:uncharacterized protein LOC111230636 isoform X1 [Seriola dumerili]